VNTRYIFRYLVDISRAYLHCRQIWVSSLHLAHTHRHRGPAEDTVINKRQANICAKAFPISQVCFRPIAMVLHTFVHIYVCMCVNALIFWLPFFEEKLTHTHRRKKNPISGESAQKFWRKKS